VYAIHIVAEDATQTAGDGSGAWKAAAQTRVGLEVAIARLSG